VYWAMHTPNIKQKIALPKGNQKIIGNPTQLYISREPGKSSHLPAQFFPSNHGRMVSRLESSPRWDRVPALPFFLGQSFAICSMRIALSFCQFEYTLSPPPPPLVSATTTQLCPVAAVDQGPDASQGQGQRSTRVEGRLRRSVLCSLPYPRRSNHHVFQRTIR